MINCSWHVDLYVIRRRQRQTSGLLQLTTSFISSSNKTSKCKCFYFLFVSQQTNSIFFVLSKLSASEIERTFLFLYSVFSIFFSLFSFCWLSECFFFERFFVFLFFHRRRLSHSDTPQTNSTSRKILSFFYFFFLRRSDVHHIALHIVRIRNASSSRRNSFYWTFLSTFFCQSSFN